jgi:hypothetical protein
MKLFSNLVKTAVGGLLCLAIPQAFSAPADLTVKSINVPAYNLISDTLIAMTPNVKGKRNDFLMQLVCDLARGDKSQQDIKEILSSNNIDYNNIPKQGSPLSILKNNNKEEQSSVCTAYISSSFLFPIDNSVLFDKVKDKTGKEETQLNLDRFNGEMKIRMSIAQATAQLYAVIANNVKNDGSLTWNDYQQNVANIVYNYAPQYLQSLKTIYASEQSSYTPVSLGITSLSVFDSTGKELTINSTGVILKSRGVEWLGNGKILGKEYFYPVKVIAGEDKKETPKQTKAVKKGRKASEN